MAASAKGATSAVGGSSAVETAISYAAKQQQMGTGQSTAAEEETPKGGAE